MNMRQSDHAAPGSRKKALFIAYEFPPMGGIASVWKTKYAKFLPSLGWEPVIISVRGAPTTIPDPGLEEDLPQGLSIRRTFSLEPTRLIRQIKKCQAKRRGERVSGKGPRSIVFSYTGLPFDLVATIKAFFIPDEKIGWLPFALPAAVKAAREPDVKVIFSSSPPYTAHLVALACKRLTGLPWVCEFIDPWVDYTHFKPLTPLNQWINRWLEGCIVRHADAVVAAMPGIVDGFKSRYKDVSVERYHVITYGYDPDDFSREVGLNKEFTITWIGSVFGDRSPQGLLKAVRGLLDGGDIDPNNFRLSFVGTTDVASYRLIKDSGIDEVVEMTGFVSYKESIEKMRSSHLLAMQLAPGRDTEFVYTGKMFEYFGAGRPTLALAGEGATKKLIEKLSAGVVVAPYDVEAICEAILYYYTLYRAGEEFSVDHPDIPELFEREKQTARLASIFDEVSGTGPKKSQGRD
jgi:glycosyltransferase involved in cell wall biosynthesis